MSNTTIYWVRLGNPHLFEARPNISQGKEIGAPRFGANLHLPEGIDIAPIQQAVIDAHLLKWPDPSKRPPLQVSVGCDPTLWNNKTPGYLRIPLVWGPTEYPDDPVSTGWVLISSANEDSPPSVVEIINGAVVRLDDLTKVYPGCECHAGIWIFGYDQGPKSKGISCGLNGVQLTGRSMPRFDSKPTNEQMFGGAAPPPPPAPPLPPGATPAAPSMPGGATGAPSMGGDAFD